MVDCKELIGQLRIVEKLNMSDCYECPRCIKAADTIETLLAELDDLRAQPAKLDRSQWEWCGWCIGFRPGVPGDPNWDYKLCPMRGRPLTKEAWAEQERRIGGNDEKSNCDRL